AGRVGQYGGDDGQPAAPVRHPCCAALRATGPGSAHRRGAGRAPGPGRGASAGAARQGRHLRPAQGTMPAGTSNATVTMLLDASESQLVLVDYQEKLMPAIHEAVFVQANALRLAKAAQLLKVPAWGTEQVPEKLG